MKNIMIATMLLASTVTFASEATDEKPVAAPAVVEQAPAEEKGFFDSILDSIKGLFD
jgi:hypothetical protein